MIAVDVALLGGVCIEDEQTNLIGIERLMHGRNCHRIARAAFNQHHQLGNARPGEISLQIAQNVARAKVFVF